jgi:hypothetical protein
MVLIPWSYAIIKWHQRIIFSVDGKKGRKIQSVDALVAYEDMFASKKQ